MERKGLCRSCRWTTSELPSSSRSMAWGFSLSFEASEGSSTGLLGGQEGAMAMTLDCPMAGHGRDACVSLEVLDADAYHYRNILQGRAPPVWPPPCPTGPPHPPPRGRRKPGGGEGESARGLPAGSSPTNLSRPLNPGGPFPRLASPDC